MNATTGGLIVPRGTDAQRPVSPAAGTIRYNTSNNVTEIYSGTGWTSVTAQTYSASYLIAAGGGGGGSLIGGGGGAGGLLTGTSTLTGGTT